MLLSRKRHSGPNQEGVAGDFGGFRRLYRRGNGIRVSEDSLDLVLSLVLSIAIASQTSAVTEMSVSEGWGLVVISVLMGHFCGEGREMGQALPQPQESYPGPPRGPQRQAGQVTHTPAALQGVRQPSLCAETCSWVGETQPWSV